MDDASGAIRIAAVMLSAPQSGMTQRPRLRSKRFSPRNSGFSPRRQRRQCCAEYSSAETSRKSGNSQRDTISASSRSSALKNTRFRTIVKNGKVSSDVSFAPKRPMTATFSRNMTSMGMSHSA